MTPLNIILTAFGLMMAFTIPSIILIVLSLWAIDLWG